MTDFLELSALEVGGALYVTNLCERGAITERLRDLGITEGTKIKCVMISPLGDPKAYEIRGAVIALRQEDASGVIGIYEPPTKEEDPYEIR